MAVIVREERLIDEKREKVKIYRTRRLLTSKLRNQAEELDKFLAGRMKEIEEGMRKTGLLELKGKKKGVLKLWYEVGRRLDFVSDTSIVSAEDRKFVWQAIYDHAADLIPGRGRERVKRDPETSHFSFCYRLGRFPWQFVLSAGNWTAWSEFFDTSIKHDERIIKWLGKMTRKFAAGSKQDWLRRLTPAVRNELRGKDTSVYSNQELYEKLDKAFHKTYGAESK